MRQKCRERFPRHRLQRKPLVSDSGMHHGTCVTHVPWCISWSQTRGGGENPPLPVHAQPAILGIWQEAHVSLSWGTHLSRISWKYKCQHGKKQYPRHRHQPVRVGPGIPYAECGSAEGHQDKESPEKIKVHEPLEAKWCIYVVNVVGHH